MINKYAEIRDRVALYNACKGVLRVKQAWDDELMQDAYNSGKHSAQISTTFSDKTRPEQADYVYTDPNKAFEVSDADEAKALADAKRFRHNVAMAAGGGLGVGTGLYFTNGLNPKIRLAAAALLGAGGAYAGHRVGNLINGD